MLNLKERHLVCTLTLLILAISVASTVYARTVDAPTPPAADEKTEPSADTPVLIMTLDGNTTAPDDSTDQPNLYQAQDAPTAVDDNSTEVTTQEDPTGAADNTLYTAQAAPDYTLAIVGCGGLLAVAGMLVAVVLVRKRKAD